MTPSPWTTPPIMAGSHVSLEPLTAAHADGLAEAVEDGRLYEIWYTSVPEAKDIAAYIDGALDKQAKGEQLVFAVRDAAGRVVGTTRYYDLAPDTPRLQIATPGTPPACSAPGLNTEAKLLLLGHAFDTMRCASVGLQTSWFNNASRTAIARLARRRRASRVTTCAIATARCAIRSTSPSSTPNGRA
jgi:RimJ/RimL family protein N-acetyltransferase